MSMAKNDNECTRQKLDRTRCSLRQKGSDYHVPKLLFRDACWMKNENNKLAERTHILCNAFANWCWHGGHIRIQLKMVLFRVRLNCIDQYQSIPTQFDPQLRNNVAPSQRHNEPRVPVIRVFGSTETGQKVCAHIHGAFPYLYVEYKGSLVQDEGMCHEF